MRAKRTVSTPLPKGARDRSSERGAALITTLLISMLLLAAGGALIMTTALSATNAADATAETQAYYAAEAGMQASLSVLRGHLAPNPLFNTASASATENKITFRQAITTPSLSRWLGYSNTFGGSRVVITNGTYSVYSGMAFTTAVSDPDNKSQVTFSVSGSFPNFSNATSHQFGSGGNRATVAYTAPAAVTINSSGTASLGSFQITDTNHPNLTINEPFNITLTQTAPSPSTAAAPTVLVISCRLRGTIVEPSTSTLYLEFPPFDTPTLSNAIGGVEYTRTATSFLIAYSGTTSVPMTVTAPQPSRVLVRVTGYGPRGAVKQMQMMVSRFAFDFKPNAAITIRGADAGGAAGIQIGNSSQYTYTGYDQSGGANLPAFAVTNGADLTTTTGAIPNATQVTGSQQVLQESLGNLSAFLQTAQGCRDLVSILRSAAYNPDPALNRYFTSSPSDFGATATNGLFTFVDGNAALPPGGGAGLLVVTGTLDMRGNADFRGLILVLGDGVLLRDGGGNGVTLGSIVVAKFGSTGDFLAPTFNSNGSGTSDVKYDSKWVDRALMTMGPRVVAVSEY